MTKICPLNLVSHISITSFLFCQVVRVCRSHWCPLLSEDDNNRLFFLGAKEHLASHFTTEVLTYTLKRQVTHTHRHTCFSWHSLLCVNFFIESLLLELFTQDASGQVHMPYPPSTRGLYSFVEPLIGWLGHSSLVACAKLVSLFGDNI